MHKLMLLCLFIFSSVSCSEKAIATRERFKRTQKQSELNKAFTSQEKYYNDYVRSMKDRASMRNQLGIEKRRISTFHAYVYFV